MQDINLAQYPSIRLQYFSIIWIRQESPKPIFVLFVLKFTSTNKIGYSDEGQDAIFWLNSLCFLS